MSSTEEQARERARRLLGINAAAAARQAREEAKTETDTSYTAAATSSPNTRERTSPTFTALSSL